MVCLDICKVKEWLFLLWIQYAIQSWHSICKNLFPEFYWKCTVFHDLRIANQNIFRYFAYKKVWNIFDFKIFSLTTLKTFPDFPGPDVQRTWLFPDRPCSQNCISLHSLFLRSCQLGRVWKQNKTKQIHNILVELPFWLQLASLDEYIPGKCPIFHQLILESIGERKPL